MALPFKFDRDLDLLLDLELDDLDDLDSVLDLELDVPVDFVLDVDDVVLEVVDDLEVLDIDLVLDLELDVLVDPDLYLRLLETLFPFLTSPRYFSFFSFQSSTSSLLKRCFQYT